MIPLASVYLGPLSFQRKWRQVIEKNNSPSLYSLPITLLGHEGGQICFKWPELWNGHPLIPLALDFPWHGWFSLDSAIRTYLYVDEMKGDQDTLMPMVSMDVHTKFQVIWSRFDLPHGQVKLSAKNKPMVDFPLIIQWNSNLADSVRQHQNVRYFGVVRYFWTSIFHFTRWLFMYF